MAATDFLYEALVTTETNGFGQRLEMLCSYDVKMLTGLTCAKIGLVYAGLQFLPYDTHELRPVSSTNAGGTFRSMVLQALALSEIFDDTSSLGSVTMPVK